jgi:6-phosphogluconolactonase
VALDSEDSNYRACLDAFLSRCPIPKSNIHTIAPSLIGTPSKAAADYSKQLAAIFGDDCDFPEFDLVLLGVGPDGHTASLFPGHELVSERNAWVASLDDSPKAPPSRITLTLPVLNSSRSVFFVAAGESKACILQGLFTTVHGTSLAIDPEVEGVIYPCGLVTGSQRLTWYVDDDAASRLHPDVMEAALPPGLGQF